MPNHDDEERLGEYVEDAGEDAETIRTEELVVRVEVFEERTHDDDDFLRRGLFGDFFDEEIGHATQIRLIYIRLMRRERNTSWLWNSFVAPKKTSLTSLLVRVSPSTITRYSTFAISKQHKSGLLVTMSGLLKALHSCRTADFVSP